MDVKKTEIFRRIVADKVVYYLSEILVETAVLCGAEFDKRLAQVHKLLRPVDFDDVAINRSSMGYCGWLGCAEQAPSSRCIELLYMIWKSEIDEDVIDSFHSLACFEHFVAIRKALDSTVSQLRQIPEELAKEYIQRRLPSSNVSTLLQRSGADAASLLVEKTRRVDTSSPAGGCSSKPPQKPSLVDEAEVAEEISHPPKRTDASRGDEEWKLIPKSLAITMSQATQADILQFDYRNSGAEKVQPSDSTSAVDINDLEYFASMNDLLDCSFDSDSECGSRELKAS